jgi:hypothetical protein
MRVDSRICAGLCPRRGTQVAIAKTQSLHGATLTYNAAAELLTGTIGTANFHEVAFSGGSRGHKTTAPDKARRYLHKSNLNDSLGRLATTPEVYVKKTDTYQQRGGTIPPGHYRCIYVGNHPTFHECIFLDPAADAHAIRSPFARHPIAHHRGGFYIHGQGPKGSDGCIVLANEQRRKALNHAVRDFIHHFHGGVILNVTNVSYVLPAELEPSRTTITT